MNENSSAALVYERRLLDGRAVLRVTMAGPHGRHVVADCRTGEAALELLAQYGVPLDQLVREDLSHRARDGG